METFSSHQSGDAFVSALEQSGVLSRAVPFFDDGDRAEQFESRMKQAPTPLKLDFLAQGMVDEILLVVEHLRRKGNDISAQLHLKDLLREAPQGVQEEVLEAIRGVCPQILKVS